MMTFAPVLRRPLRTLAVMALLVAPAAAVQAAPGLATAEVNLRAGPSTDYTVVATIPRRAPVEIHGCVAKTDWCDVGWKSRRGWVSARFLAVRRAAKGSSTPPSLASLPTLRFERQYYWRRHYPNEAISNWQGRNLRRHDRLSDGQFGGPDASRRLQQPTTPSYTPPALPRPFDATRYGRGNPGRTPWMQPGSRRGLY